MKNDSKSNNQSSNGNNSSKSQKSDSKNSSGNGSNSKSNGNSKNSSNGNGGSNGNGSSKTDSKSSSKNGSKSDSKSDSKSKSKDSDESDQQSEESASQMIYHQMDFSVSRMVNGEQTDIRIHRETGQPTDIYVSQGGESWTLTPNELDRLPKELEEEVRMLLNPEKQRPLDSWLGFFSQSDSSRRETPKLTRRQQESSSRH